MTELNDVSVGDDDGYFDALRAEFAASVTAMYGESDGAEDVIAHAVSGSVKRMDALKLRALISVTAPERILEVGSFLGFSTRVILDASAGLGSSVVSLDPRLRHHMFDDIKAHVLAFNPSSRLVCRDAFFAGRNVADLLHDYTKYEPRLTKRQARRLLRSVEVVKSPFDEFDFVFIDGDHSYRATMANLALALRMARPGCVVAIHDAITWPTVRPAAEDLARLVPGVEVVGVTGSDPGAFFVTDETDGIVQRLRRLRARFWGASADGLCIVSLGHDADIEAVRVACETITPEVIAEQRRRRGETFGAGAPPETGAHKAARRARLVRSQPVMVARKVVRRGRALSASRGR